jgi:hypothetical protein
MSFFAISIFARDFDTTRLRINLVFAGNAKEQSVFLTGMNLEPRWGGPTKSLIDPFDYGEYRYRVVSTDGRQLFSRGFSTLFHEWRFTDEAKQTSCAQTVSAVIPCPRDSVYFEVDERNNATGGWNRLFRTAIDPADPNISREQLNDYAVNALQFNGDPAKKVDITFIAEGYTADEMDKFRADAVRMADALFSEEPFTSRRNDFNIWTVEAVSKESGVDIPNRGIWKNTAANANFYTFNVDRYLTTPDHRLLSDIAWQTPYDMLYVIVNTDKYGGGGIFNFCTVCSSDNNASAAVIVHEFGHSFAGLGDEYAYDEPDPFSEFYNKHTEPWEPNITTLVAFDRKWKDMIDAGNKEVGLVEGAGYSTKGIYRPTKGCIMRGLNDRFCPVCRRAINNMIDYYTLETK